MASDSELIDRLREFLRNSDLNTTTNAIVRRRLEEDFGIDLSDKKAFIREQVDLFLQNELQNAEEENEEGGDDDEDDNQAEKIKSEETDDSESVEVVMDDEDKDERNEEEEDEADEEEPSDGKPAGKRRSVILIIVYANLCELIALLCTSAYFVRFVESAMHMHIRMHWQLTVE